MSRVLNVLVIACLCLALLPFSSVEAQLLIDTPSGPTASISNSPSLTLPLRPAYVPGQVIIKLHDGVTLSQGPGKPASANRAALAATLSRIGARQSARVFSDALAQQRTDKPGSAVSDLARIYRLKLNEGVDVQTAVAALSADPNVEYAEPDYIAQAADTQRFQSVAPDDPLYPAQWGLAKIGAEAAWNVVTGTPGVNIAIVDSGLDLTHPDFANRLWINPGEIADNGVDDDNDGYVDDVNGWDFVYGTNNVVDEKGHGTEVAGVAGASANNGAGIAGLCWNCRLMVVKVMQPSGIANYSDVAAGVAYAAAKGAHVINLSLGGYADSATLRAAIQAASETAVIVGGAGNDGVSTPFYPAAYPTVLAAAATDSSDAPASFSNHGAWVDVAAPGVAITTTFTGGDWGATSGTSLSAPFVSGLAGLLRSLHPDWSPALVRSHIAQTADGWTGSLQLGPGRINAARAVEPPHPLLSVSGQALNGATSGRPSPGRANNLLVIALRNDWFDAANVTGVLSSSDPNVTVVNANATFGTIATGATANGSAFSFDVAGGAGYNHDIAFSLALSSDGGAYSVTLPFTLMTRGPEEIVSGYITADTLWTSDHVYILNSDVAVNAGVTLTIQPGTVVKFGNNAALNVNGTLIADGGTERPIAFKSNTGGTWNRIYLGDASPDAQADADGNYLSGSILRHVTLESSKGGIGCGTATPYLSHITSALGGINCAPGATPLWALDNTLSGGLYVTLGTVYARGNTLSGKGLVATGAAVVLSNTVTGASLSIGTGLLSGNTVNGGSLGLGSNSTAQDNTIIGGGISAGNTVTVTGNTVTGGGISVGSASTVMSNTVQNAPGVGLTAGNNVVARANRLIGNGQGLVAVTGLVSNNLIAYSAGHGMQVSANATNATTVLSNSFTGNAGNAIVVNGTSAIALKIEGNNFEHNVGLYDLYVSIPWSSGVYVPANRNWWGVTTSDAIAARIYDFNDNSANAKVTYINWLSGPSEDAPAYVRSVSIGPDTVLGIQTGVFTVTFSRPMNQGVFPSLTFYTARRGSWSQYTSANSSLPGNTVGAVAVDLNGTPWFGTAANGAAHLVTPTWTLYNLANSGLPGNAVNTIAADSDGSVWFGTASGAARLSGGAWTVYTATGSALPDNDVLAITVDSDRAKWIGTGNGLAWFDGATWVTYTLGNSGLPSNRVTAMAEDADRSKWFGTDGGVAQFDGLGWTAYNAANSSLPSNNVRAIAVDADGVKWIGTDAGLARYDGATWTVYTATNSLPSNDVRAIAVDANNVKWVGTAGGLARFDDVKWISYTVASSGLPDNDVRALAVDTRSEKWLGLGAGGVGVFHDSPDYVIGQSAAWGDSKQYRAMYDFTALISKGVYSLTTSSAMGADGLLSAPNLDYVFTIDYASFVSDDTPPPPPSVAASGDGSLTAISMSWIAADPDSSITAYRYAVGDTPGGQQVVNWTPVTGTTTLGNLRVADEVLVAGNAFTRAGLSLLAGQAYYVTVQARNAGGLWSQKGTSNRVVAGEIDSTPPTRPVITALNDGSLSTFSISWSSQDAESGIDQYRYALGITPGGHEVVDWTYAPMTTSSVTLTGLSLVRGQTCYATVAARNTRGLWSEDGVSDAVVVGVDSTPPTRPVVVAANDGSLTTISISWSSADPQSGIDQYKYALGSTVGGQDVVSWTLAPGTATSVTLTGLSLVQEQTYYATVAARNASGLWSETGVSNPVVAGVAWKKVYLPVVLR